MTAHDLERKGFVLVDGIWKKWLKPKKVKNEIDHLPSGAKPEHPVFNVALGPAPRKEKNPTSRKVSIVRVVSYRKRLLDADNLIGGCKYFIDALRYCGIIADDTAKHITLEVRQEKSDNPRTEIEIT